MATLPPSGPSAPSGQRPDQAALGGNYQKGYGSPDKLNALAEGYFGINRAHIFNVLIPIAAIVGMNFAGAYVPRNIPVYLIASMAMLALTLVMVLPSARRIGEGKGWPETTAVLASLGVALSAAAYVGVIGGLFLQFSALSEMKNYGITNGIMTKRKDIDVEVAKMKRERGLYTR